MADYTSAAKKFLDTRKRQPWDEPLSDKPAGVTAKKEDEPKPKPKSMQDEVDEQYGKLKKRNEDLAKRTRHLRKD